MKQRKEAGTDFERRLDVTQEYDPANPEQPAKIIQGFEWTQLPGVDERLEQHLWNAGIVAIEDLFTNPQAVIGALMAYHALGLSALRQSAKEYQENVKQ